MVTEPTLPNRYRIEVRHSEQDGTDVEVIAADEADALAQAQAAAPEGSTLHRIVPMEIGYVAPTTDPPPVSTDPTSTGMAARSSRASGVASEPRIEGDDEHEDDTRKTRRKRE